MAPHIESRERQRSATDTVESTGEPENEALLQALEQWKQRKREEGPPKNDQERLARARYFLEHVLWPNLPPSARRSLSREEEKDLFGYGPEGTENRESESPTADVTERTGLRENEALLQALERRKQRRLEEGYPTDYHERAAQFWEFLENEVWPNLPPSARKPLTKAEEAKLLGYGPEDE